MSDAAIGHNLADGIGVDEESFLQHAKTIGALEAEKKVLQAKINKARKAAKADGIQLGIFDAMRKIADLSRPEQQEHISHSKAYLVWLKSPIGLQFSLDLEDDPSLDPGEEADERIAAQVVEDARGAGYRAALKGEWMDTNPHEANSEAGQAWIAGYNEAQEVQVRKMGDAAG